MSKQYPGGLITKTPVTPSGPYETSTASGIWTLDQQAYWQKLGQWPTAGNPPPDAQFNYVTMLLHGDGTNGAQNNTFLDSSTNNFTITRNGNTTQGSFSPYGSNWGVYFGGVGNYLTTATSASGFSFGTSDFTVEFWINSTQTTRCDPVGQDTLFTASGWWGFIFNLSGSGNMAWYENANSRISASGTNWNNGQWNHVALTRSGNSVRMFLNGTQVGSTYTTSFTYGASSVGIINGVISDGKSDGPLTGYLSNVRIVKGTAVYTSSFTPSTTPLTAISGTSLLTNQSNRFIDNSSNALAITLTGSPSVQRFNPFGTATAYSTSVIGGSGYFDGSGDSLSLPNNVALDFGTGDFTIEVWIYPTSLPTSYQCVFITCNNTGSAGGIGLFTQSTGEIEVYDFAGNGAVFSTSGFNLKTNQWTNIAVTRSGSTNTLYKNGVSFATATNSSNYNSSTDTVIGNSTTASQTFYGYISALRVLKGTAQAPTITTPPTNITNTSLLLSMTNGAIFDNAMMNDLETVGNAQISTSVVKYGTGSLAFDGTGDYLRAPDSPIFNFGSGNWTIEGWFYISTAKNYNGWFGKRQTGLFGFTLQIDSSGVLSISASITGSTWALAGASLGSGYSAGAWMHVAVTRNGTTITGWLNGTSTGTQTLSGAIFPANGFPATIGSSNDSGQDFNGYIDDFRITNGYARYTTTFTPPTAAFPNIGPT